jgi:hypothetical protein
MKMVVLLIEAFRAVLRAHYPSRPALADEIQDAEWFRPPFDGSVRPPEEVQAARDACAALRDAIAGQQVRLRGRREDRDYSEDIDPTDIARSNDIWIFQNALDRWQQTTQVSQYRQLPKYLNVHCYAEDIAAMIGMPSTASTKQWKKPTDGMVRAKIKDAYSEDKTADGRAPNINEIPEFVRPRLNADGYDTSDAHIKAIAGEPEFRALRGRTGVRAT